MGQTKFPWLDSYTDDIENILPGVDPVKVTGTIVTSGSSTVFPLSEAVADRFRKDGYKGQISIDSIGSGGGFERFGQGEIDIANASRAIKESERTRATERIGEVLSFRVGTDAIVVCVSSKNSFAKNLTLDQLAKLFSTAATWAEVDPAFPAKAIKRYAPGTDSGTFDYFVEHVFGNKKGPLLNASSLQMSEDDNVLVQGVEGSEYAVGFFGFAYYLENAKKLNALSIKGVSPGQASVDAGTYPLSRPLYLYSSSRIVNEKPQVAAFLAYYLANVNLVIKKVGYFPAPEEELREAKRAFVAAVKSKL